MVKEHPAIKKGALVRSLPEFTREAWATAVAVEDSYVGSRGGTPVVRLYAEGRIFTRLVRHVEVISQ